MRAGTENVSGIVGFAKALELAQQIWSMIVHIFSLLKPTWLLNYKHKFLGCLSMGIGMVPVCIQY